MKLTTSALFALVASPVSAWKHTSEASFRQSLKDNERTLVAFVEPSLESCKQLDTEWTAVTDAPSTHGATVISIDCAKERKLCDGLDVASYPAIRLYHHDGKVQRYRGVREAPDLLAFLRRTSRPILSTVNDNNVTDLLTDDEVVFVASYAQGGSKEDTLPKRFAALAQAYSDRYTFAVSTSTSTSASSSITCHRPHGQGQLVRTATELDVSTTALDAFLDVCTAPLVVDLTRRNEMRYMSTGKSLVHFLYQSPAERRAYVNEVRPLAQKYGEYLAFTVVDVREYQDIAEALGLGEKASQKNKIGGPLLAVQNPSNGDVFPFPAARHSGDGPPAAAVVEQYLLDIIQGAIPPWKPGAGGASHDEL